MPVPALLVDTQGPGLKSNRAARLVCNINQQTRAGPILGDVAAVGNRSRAAIGGKAGTCGVSNRGVAGKAKSATASGCDIDARIATVESVCAVKVISAVCVAELN